MRSTPAAFTDDVEKAGYRVLTTNRDRNGEIFVSTMEHVSAPITSVQWHPESNQFDFDPSDQIVHHGMDAVSAMSWLAMYFVEMARASGKREEPESGYRIEETEVEVVDDDYKFVFQ